MRIRNLLMAGVAAMAVALPAMADPVVIRIASKDLLSSNPQDVAHIERIEAAMAAQGTEVDLQIVDLPSSGYADALGVMLLSGDIPDIIYFQGGDQAMAEQGILEDLRPWIAESEHLQGALYPHNVERLENYPYLLYAYPLRIPQPVIRTSWLEQTGLGVPGTVEEFTALLTAASQGDLDGDGTANTFGVTTADTTAELDAVFNQAFGISATWMQDAEGGWVNSVVSDQERAKLGYYRSLVEAGLMDPEYISTNWEVKEDKFYTGRAAVIFGSSAEVIDIYGGKLRQVEPDATLTLLAPPAGEGGQGLMAVDVSKESRGLAVSALSENKDVAFAVLDFLASPEGQMMERMGFEGEHYTVNADGTYEILPAMSTWYVRFMSAANWQPPASGMSPAALQSLDNLATYYTPDNVFVWPADFAADRDATTNVYRQWVYRFLTGEASLDSDWDAYVAEWNAAGGERMTEYAGTVLQ